MNQIVEYSEYTAYAILLSLIASVVFGFFIAASRISGVIRDEEQENLAHHLRHHSTIPSVQNQEKRTPIFPISAKSTGNKRDEILPRTESMGRAA